MPALSTARAKRDHQDNIPAISLAESADPQARLRTLAATTAKLRPPLPARAASITAGGGGQPDDPPF